MCAVCCASWRQPYRKSSVIASFDSHPKLGLEDSAIASFFPQRFAVSQARVKSLQPAVHLEARTSGVRGCQTGLL